MAIQFPTSKKATVASATWLDNLSKFSGFCVVRWDTVNTSRQYVWSHYGVTNRISLRKDNAANLIWFATVVGGNTATVSIPGAVVAGTRYAIGWDWTKSSATGMRLYKDGVLAGGPASTTTQTVNYDSGGASFDLARRDSSSPQYGICTIERLGIWTEYVLSATKQALLARGFWPHQIGCPMPAFFYSMPAKTPTLILDSTRNRRHITTVDSGLVGVAPFGPVMPPDLDGPEGQLRRMSSGSGPAPPNDWTTMLDVDTPLCAGTVTGLVNGTTYEFKLNSIDTDGLMSPDSNIVELTPSAPPVTPASHSIPWRRLRRQSKYRGTQQ